MYFNAILIVVNYLSCMFGCSRVLIVHIGLTDDALQCQVHKHEYRANVSDATYAQKLSSNPIVACIYYGQALATMVAVVVYAERSRSTDTETSYATSEHE